MTETRPEMIGLTCPDCGQEFEAAREVYQHLVDTHDVDKLAPWFILGAFHEYGMTNDDRKIPLVSLNCIVTSEQAVRRWVTINMSMNVAKQLATLTLQADAGVGPYSKSVQELVDLATPVRKRTTGWRGWLIRWLER